MRKDLEATNVNSCWNRAKDDEMVFVLLARDPSAPHTIRSWVKSRIALGKNVLSDPQIQEALYAAEQMEKEWAANRAERGTATLTETKPIPVKAAVSRFKYHTLCTCPVCGALFDDISHAEPEPHGQMVAMMAGDGRREHAKESPACTKHPDWIKGWNTKTEEIK